MSKVKYYYDSETLSYRKIEKGKLRSFKSSFLFLLSSALFAFLFFFVGINFFSSPKEKALQRELENMTLQYEIIEKDMNTVEDVLNDIQNRDNNIYRLYFEANPIPEEQRKAGFGGVNRYKNLDGFENSNRIKAAKRRLDILKKQLLVQTKSLDEIAELAKNKEKFLSSIPAIIPVQNKDLTRMASGFGYRTDPFTKARRKHKGMDFTAPKGTPIYATGDGKIVRADAGSTGYGKHIRIDHGYGYVTLYAHLSDYKVRKGQKVKRGEIIGFVGNTGRSQAPHLHYEVRKDGEAINPINFYYADMTDEEYALISKLANQENSSLD